MPILGSVIKNAIALRSKLPYDNRKNNPGALQLKTLRGLVRTAQNTKFGEAHQFGQILKSKDPAEQFRKQVPIYDYKSLYREWWYRTLNNEPYVTWPGRVKYFALSSGTSESSSKHIPVTADMLKAIKKTSIRQIFSLANFKFPQSFYEKGILMLGGSTHLQYNGAYYEGDLSGITAGNIPFWFQHFYKPGRRISKERDWNTKLDEIVKKAKQWDIGVICGVPAWLQILMERIIDYYEVDTIHDIWPNLNIYVHGGVSFAPYKQGFEKLLAHPLTYIETYLASEGFIAYQSRPQATGMELVLDNGVFMEFVPYSRKNFDEEGNIKPDAQTLLIDEVEKDTEYALLISTVSGAWRYMIGDMIRFVDLERREIIITGRTKFFLNYCGEHLSQENMNRAIELTGKDLEVDIREFAVSAIRHGSMFAHKWFLGTDDSVDPELAKSYIDNHLKKLNDDYRVERIEAIKDIFVEVLPVSLFYEYMSIHGKIGGQHKFPRVLKNGILEDWEAFLEKSRKINNQKD
jgi:hypothetical protein